MDESKKKKKRNGIYEADGKEKEQKTELLRWIVIITDGLCGRMGQEGPQKHFYYHSDLMFSIRRVPI